MARTTNCPYCWHTFKDADLLRRCSASCPAKDQTFFHDRDAAKGNCPHGRRPVQRRFCPECKKVLLREYLENQGSNVAVIGSAASGKTTYIGVLLHELRGRVATAFNGMAVDLLGDESRKNYDERFATPLFDLGETVRKTPALVGDSKIEPLIFTLKFPAGRAVLGGTKVHSALSVFYDASGENMITADAMDPLVRYLDTAGGILLLIDPMAMPAVRRRFGNTMSRSAQATKMLDQQVMIERLSELLRESATHGNRKHAVPLAVALTKIDLLRDSFEADSPLRRTARHDGYYDDDDGRDVHEEVRGWLDEWFGPAFDNSLAANFATYRYFGLTSLGAPPQDEAKIAASGVHPYRVEDPMLWLLAKFGSVKSRRGKR
ncbi:hypothetical protein ACFFOM_13720 [Microlunatus capsulatus]|uniref:GTPase SAR1 family protein n=1 Tax=Microlunatus capsulatus TaxID=99117 RepID=A0ABS4Z8U9_9ACTN|nr:hypothetical protein [Microlunatus capsulatus]MBP2417195.1 GTPase SAR1 family protein [Microlunatus capsulatus]